VISPKSETLPQTHITWLGKELSSPIGIVNSPVRLSQLLMSILFLRCVRCSFRGLQRVLGSLQWAATPLSICAPFLAPAYHLLYHYEPHRVPLLPLRHLSFLLTAFLHSLLAAYPRPQPPPTCMPPLFVDAASCTASCFIVACCRPASYATSVQAPSWVRSQQDAEMYAVFHGLRQCAIRGLSHVCVYTDNYAVFHSLTSLRVSGSTPARARILRRIIRLCLSRRINFQLARVPSSLNPADPYSRPSTILWSTPTSHHLPLLSHPSYEYAPACPALWHRVL